MSAVLRCLAALLTAAAVGMPHQTFAAELEEEKAPVAVWIQPVWAGVFLLSPEDHYVPIGFNIPMGPRRTLSVELSYLRYRGQADPVLWEWDYGILAVGPAFQLSGQRPLLGAFIQPKVILLYVRNRTAIFGPEFPNRDDTFAGPAFQVGVDVGYHLRLGPVYLAPILGVSAGYGRYMPGDFVSAYPLELAGGVGHRPSLDVNLNLLRAGGAF